MERKEAKGTCGSQQGPRGAALVQSLSWEYWRHLEVAPTKEQESWRAIPPVFSHLLSCLFASPETQQDPVGPWGSWAQKPFCVSFAEFQSAGSNHC